MLLTLYTVLYFTATLASALSAIFAWRRRDARGGIWLCLMSVATFFWALAEMADYSSIALSTHVMWGELSYIGATTAPVFFLLFAFEYTGPTRLTRPGPMVALFIVPALSILAAFTNQVHHQLWTGFELMRGQPNIIVYHHGWVYWIVTLYGLGLGLVASVRLIGVALRARHLYRMQSAAVVTAVMVPWVAQLGYSLYPSAYPGFDPSVTVAFTGSVLTFTMLRFKLLDVEPVAREVLVDEMSDGLLVLDGMERVLEINPAAISLLGLTHRPPAGESIFKLLDHWPEALLCLTGPDACSQCGNLVSPAGVHIDVNRSRLSEGGEDEDRHLYMLHDVTAQVTAEQVAHDAMSNLQAQMEETQRLQAELREQAIRDPLTSLHNRRYLAETLERELGRAAREGYPVSLVMFDLDDFKDVNDTLGHAAGDAVLRAVGAEMRAGTRLGDINCRYGGDEFLVVLPNTDLATAELLAERLRTTFPPALEEALHKAMRPTLSLGIAAFPLHGTMPEELIAAADSAVYASKAAGRDHASVAAESSQAR